MRIRPLGSIPALPAHGQTAVRIQRLGRAADAELKLVTIEPGATVPPHAHGHTHLVLVLDGSGVVGTEAGRRQMGPEDVVGTVPYESHSFAAGPGSSLRFLCLDAPGNTAGRPARHEGHRQSHEAGR